MEMLIVVAIIAILIAIAIPIFSYQLERSREATDSANERSAKAMALTEYMTDATQSAFVKYFDAASGTLTDPDLNPNPAPYGQGTDAGAISEDHRGKWISCSVTADGILTMTWTDGGAFSGNTLPGLSSNLITEMNKLLKTGELKNETSATYNGNSYKYSAMDFNYGYTQIGSDKLGTLLSNAGLSSEQLATLKNGNAKVYYSNDKSSVTGIAYDDPNDSTKEILLYPDGSTLSVDKGINEGYYGSILAGV